MPAVTADTLTLPRLLRPGAETPRRPVTSVATAARALEGEGFPVRRPFPGAGLTAAETDPFILLDHMGPIDWPPGEAKGTSWHPHRGFETVTYMIDGLLEHADSIGGGGVIADGATQWMTAGGGILHIERPPEPARLAGGPFHGVQLWVNLPAEAKFVPPRYQDIGGGDVVLMASDDGGALVRVIAGDVDGRPGPGSTHTPIRYLHATVGAGARVSMAWPEAFSAMAYALSGRGFAGADRRPFEEGQLVTFGPGAVVELAAADRQPSERSDRLEVLLLGGTPLREPVFQYGPFVMNTKQQIVDAIEDFQAGRLGQVPATELRPRGT